MSSETATFIQWVITALLGFAGGLGGVALQSYLQRRDRAEDHGHKKNEILREKAERVYLEIQQAMARTETAATDALKEEHGLLEEGKAPTQTDIQALRALLMMYFPDTTELVSKYDVDMYVPISEYSKAFEEIDEIETVDARLKHVRAARTKSEREKTKITVKFLVELRSLMDAQSKKLI